MEVVLASRFNYRKPKESGNWSKVAVMQKCLAKGWKLAQRKPKADAVDILRGGHLEISR